MSQTCEPRVAQLVQDIHELYARECALADALRGGYEAEDRRLIERCRAPESPGIPELRYFTSIFDRQEAIQTAHRDPAFRRRVQRAQTVNWFVVAVGCVMVFRWTDSMLITALFCLAVGGGLTLAQHRLRFRALLQGNLRKQLVERGVPICVACGYDLRGQTVPRCPECGARCEASLLGSAGRGF